MKNQKMKSMCLLLAAFFLSLTGFAQIVELTFVDHLKAGLIEQDVFVLKNGCVHEVSRVFPEEREQYLDSEIFATKETQYHNPFSREAAGPYKKGRSSLISYSLLKVVQTLVLSHQSKTLSEKHECLRIVFPCVSYDSTPNSMCHTWP